MSDTPKISIPPHVQTIEHHPKEPWYRRYCSCGWRGVWLKSIDAIKPCPKAS